MALHDIAYNQEASQRLAESKQLGQRGQEENRDASLFTRTKHNEKYHDPSGKAFSIPVRANEEQEDFGTSPSPLPYEVFPRSAAWNIQVPVTCSKIDEFTGISPLSSSVVDVMNHLVQWEARALARNAEVVAGRLGYHPSRMDLALTDYIAYCQDVSVRMRMTVLDWVMDVQRAFNLRDDTLFLSVHIFDRYLSTEFAVRRNAISRTELQLVASAAILIAAKMEEVKMFAVNGLLYLCAGAYDKNQLDKMEQKICNGLGYEFCRVPILEFAQCFLSITKSESDENLAVHLCAVKRIMMFLLDNTLLNRESYAFSPSTVAMSALELAVWVFQLPDNFSRVQLWLTGESERLGLPVMTGPVQINIPLHTISTAKCKSMILQSVEVVRNSKFKALAHKYAAKKCKVLECIYIPSTS